MRTPLPGAHFRVFIDDREVGIQAITPLQLLDAASAGSELRQTVTLRRAVGADRTLFEWGAAAAAGKEDSRAVTLVMLDSPGGRPVNIWRLEGARAVRWSGPGLDALSADLACEELEIAYESIAWRTSV